MQSDYSWKDSKMTVEADILSALKRFKQAELKDNYFCIVGSKVETSFLEVIKTFP